MTRDQLVGLISTNLDDAGVFHTQVEIRDAIQDSYDELILANGLLPKATAIDVVAHRVFYDMPTLITDFVALRGIYYAPTKKWLDPCSLRGLVEQTLDWELKRGTPTDFWPANYRRVAIYPHPIVDIENALWVFYYAQAPTLTDTSQDLNVPFSSGFRALENMATGEMLIKAEEWAKAEAYFAQAKEDSMECENYRNSLKLPDYIPGLRGVYL